VTRGAALHETGGTLRRVSGVSSQKVGGLAPVGGQPFFSGQDPNEGSVGLINNPVDYLTRDMRSPRPAQ
jgi:hypothetical protein